MKTTTPIQFLILFATLLFFPNPLNAQDQGKLVTLKKGKIFTTDGNLIGFQMLRQTDEKFFYQNIKGEFIGISKSDVTLIQKQNSSYAFRYGLTSGASAIFGYFIGSAVSNRQLSQKTKRNGLILSSICGTLFGVIYGSTKKKYSTVYQSPNLGKKVGHLKLDSTTPNAIPSLTLSYTF
ncbi:MAG: hypothetical protein AB8F94_09520 [Saprospiraceae bacterium]